MSAPFRQKWAILLGVTDYQHVQPLKHCVDDVVALRKALLEHLEFEGNHVLEFGVGLKHAPDFATFWHEAGGFVKSGSIREDDLLLFYFTGHGIQEKGKDYLLPRDASPNNLKQTGLAVEDVIDQLKQTKCKNIVMFLDACREAITGKKGVLSIGAESKTLVERAGIITFFSCDPEQISFEIEDLKHSSFTYCVLEAIQKSECSTAGELSDYLLSKVPVLNQRFKKPPQRPYAVIIPDDKRNLPILHSNARRLDVLRNYDATIDQLSILFEDESLSPAHFTLAVEVVSLAKESPLQGDAARKLQWILMLCEGKLSPRAFEAVLASQEKRAQHDGVALKNLDPIQ